MPPSAPSALRIDSTGRPSTSSTSSPSVVVRDPDGPVPVRRVDVVEPGVARFEDVAVGVDAEEVVGHVRDSTTVAESAPSGRPGVEQHSFSVEGEEIAAIQGTGTAEHFLFRKTPERRHDSLVDFHGNPLERYRGEMMRRGAWRRTGSGKSLFEQLLSQYRSEWRVDADIHVARRSQRNTGSFQTKKRRSLEKHASRTDYAQRRGNAPDRFALNQFVYSVLYRPGTQTLQKKTRSPPDDIGIFESLQQGTGQTAAHEICSEVPQSRSARPRI